MDRREQIDELVKEAKFKFDIYAIEEAEECILMALKMAKSEELDMKIVDCLDLWGYFKVKGFRDIEKARNSYKEAISILLNQQKVDHNRISKFYYRLSLTYYRTDPNELIKLTNKAIEFIQKTGDSEFEYNDYFLSLGYGYRQIGDYEKSEEYYLKYLELKIRKNIEHKNEFAWAHVLKDISMMYSESNQNEKAEKMMKRYEIAVEEGLYKDKPWLRKKG